MSSSRLSTPLFGQPALAPWRLALVTILQFAEDLSDRKAADAVRARLDWKYLLRLDLGDAGVVGETMRHALNTLAVVAPTWLAEQADPAWVERYAERGMDDHLPASRPARLQRAVTVGRDGYALLAAIGADDALAWLRRVPAVETVRRVWVQNYQITDGEVAWRADDAIPPAARFIGSPYDLDAHYARKRTTSWLGYKLHVTETCDPGLPRLITDVKTTAAPVVDEDSPPSIQRALAARDLLPSVQLADSGYTAAGLLVDSRRLHGIELIGAARPDVKWQAQQGVGFAAADFRVDWETEQATCPMGRVSASWTLARDGRKGDLVKVKFGRADCVPYSCRPRRTRAKDGRHTLTLRPPEQAQALQQARERAKAAAFAATYARREGVEGTLSLGIRVCSLRRARYIGLARTRLQHLLTAAAVTFLRLGRWLTGTPPARTRRTAFVRLMQEVAVA